MVILIQFCDLMEKHVTIRRSNCNGFLGISFLPKRYSYHNYSWHKHQPSFSKLPIFLSKYLAYLYTLFTIFLCMQVGSKRINYRLQVLLLTFLRRNHEPIEYNVQFNVGNFSRCKVECFLRAIKITKIKYNS